MALGPDANAAVPDLIQLAFDSKDPFQRAYTAALVAMVGVESREALEAVIKLLHDSDQVVQDRAALAVVEFGTDAAPAVPRLIEIVRSHPEGKPYSALMALAGIGPPGNTAVPAIVERLKQPELHANALSALVRMPYRLSITYSLPAKKRGAEAPL